MPNYKDLYKDIFENPKNYKNRNYNANGLFKKSPIFIGGSGRSGTTILARTLSQHPDTLNFVEVRFLLSFKKNKNLCSKLPPFYKRKATHQKITRGLRVAGYRDADRVYSKNILKNICLNDAATATKRFFEIGLKAWNKSVLIEKTPHTFLVADTLYKIFPNMRYVHVFRDPRDVYASVKPLHWGPISSKSFVPWYNKLMSTAYNIKKQVPRSNYLLVRLEDLVYNTKEELTKVFRFTNLNLDEDYIRLITKEKAHINRFVDELTKDEIDVVWKGCNHIYVKWKKLYNKERNI